MVSAANAVVSASESPAVEHPRADFYFLRLTPEDVMHDQYDLDCLAALRRVPLDDPDYRLARALDRKSLHSRLSFRDWQQVYRIAKIHALSEAA
jgi:hypothetical protein